MKFVAVALLVFCTVGVLAQIGQQCNSDTDCAGRFKCYTGPTQGSLTANTCHCPAGSVVTEELSCLACPAATYSVTWDWGFPNPTPCTACPAETSTLPGEVADSKNKCHCPAGRYVNGSVGEGGNCACCPSGTFSSSPVSVGDSSGSSACSSCPSANNVCSTSCNGNDCTRTYGYWKTHTNAGNAPYDTTWDDSSLPSGEDSPFFASGKTYIQILKSPVQGNKYYILAHQYIAAHMNKLAGATFSSTAQAAYNQATTLFNGLSGDTISNSQKALFVSLASTLDAYNNGMDGPGHCDGCGDLYCVNGNCVKDDDGQESCDCLPGFSGSNCGESSCSTCTGELTELVLEYTGDATVWVRVQKTDEFSFPVPGKWVNPGDTLTISAEAGKTLSEAVHLFVNFQKELTIQTCCHYTVGPGLVLGNWLVKSGASEGGALCPLEGGICKYWLCENGGTCFEGQKYPSCNCAAGFSGPHCRTNIDECASNPCQNGGTCIDGNFNFECKCVPGYTGKDCSQDIDECSSSPCQNGGTCHDNANGFTCECTVDYTGETCGQVDVDECATNPCQNGATCFNLNGRAACRCTQEFTGPTCSEAVTCATCTGGVSGLELQYQGDNTAVVKVVEEQTGLVVFERSVCPGESFCFSPRDSVFGNNVQVSVNGQSNAQFDTSCSTEIGPGLSVGSFEVVSGTSTDGGDLCKQSTPVKFRYTIDDGTDALFLNGVDITSQLQHPKMWNGVDELTWALKPGSGPHVLALQGRDLYGVLQGYVARLFTPYTPIFTTGSATSGPGLSVKYSSSVPPAGWTDVNFDDAQWKHTAVHDQACVNHLDDVELDVGGHAVWIWPGGCANPKRTIYTRIIFTVPERPAFAVNHAFFRYTIDDGTNAIYMNGKSIALSLPNRFRYDQVDTIPVPLTPGVHIIAGTGQDIYGHCAGIVARVYDCGSDWYVTGGPTVNAQKGFEIKYTDQDPGDSAWTTVGYDDSAWTTQPIHDAGCAQHSDEIEKKIGGAAKWIWPNGCGDLGRRVWFRAIFTVKRETATLRYTIDDETEAIYVNGKAVTDSVANRKTWNQIDDVVADRSNGLTVFALTGGDTDSSKTGLVARLFDQDGNTLFATGSTPSSDVTIKVTTSKPPHGWQLVGFDDSSWSDALPTSSSCNAHDSSVATAVGAAWVWPGTCEDSAPMWLRIKVAGKCESTICDQCASQPCLNGGTCTSLPDSYRCDCPPTYGGNNCETPNEPCDVNPCQNSGTCVNTPNDPVCVDEWSQTTLGVGGTFKLKNHPWGSARNPQYGLRLDKLLPGSRIVTFDFEASGSDMKLTWSAEDRTLRIFGRAMGGKDCGQAYCSGYPTPFDIDFVYKDVQINANNLNVPLDLQDVGHIIDVNNNKVYELVASQMIGSFFRIAQGHRGVGATWSGWGWLDHSGKAHVAASDWMFTIGECIDSGSQNDNFEDRRTCQCPPGFTGDNCQTNIDDCAEHACQNGATCIDGIDSYTCKCPEDFVGTYCQTSNNMCGCAPCYNGGTCVDNFFKYSCICPAGFTGDDCANPCRSCDGKITKLTLEYQGIAPATVMARDEESGDFVFGPSRITPGTVFSVSGQSSFGTFFSGLRLLINEGTDVVLDTTCDTSVGPGFKAGNFKVVAGESRFGGVLCPVSSSQPSQTPSTASFGGMQLSSNTPPGQGPAPVKDYVCSACKDGISTLRLALVGGGATTVRCFDANGQQLFEAPIKQGESFSIPPLTKNGVLGAKVLVYVNDGNGFTEHASIITDCSAKLFPGTIIGKFQLISGESKGGVPLCTTDAGANGPGDEKTDLMQGNTACSACAGDINDLTLRYDGHSSCTGNSATVSISDVDGNVIFTNALPRHGVFTVAQPLPSKHLSPYITATFCGSTTVKVDTTCSTVMPGAKAEGLTILKAESTVGGNICSPKSTDPDESSSSFFTTTSGIVAITIGAMMFVGLSYAMCKTPADPIQAARKQKAAAAVEMKPQRPIAQSSSQAPLPSVELDPDHV